jgi:hypothetical protein
VAVVRARWSSSSFLLYAGGLVVLLAAYWALTILSTDYGSAGLAGWAALVTAVLLAVAVVLLRGGKPVAAGVFAFVAVLAFAVLVGALERWWGWLPDSASAFGGTHWGLFLAELAVVAAALAALRVFRFPLLVAVVAGVGWYLVTDLVSNGGDWSATVTFLVGVVFLVAARRFDRGPSRPYGFWLHVAAGLTIGGSLLWFWHSGDFEWSLVSLTAILYIGYAWVLDRSSWAVLGAFGLFLAAAHFAAEWGSAQIAAPVLGGLLSGAGGNRWAGPLVYAFLGFLLVVLGLIVERRRAAATSAG